MDRAVLTVPLNLQTSEVTIGGLRQSCTWRFMMIVYGTNEYCAEAWDPSVFFVYHKTCLRAHTKISIRKE